MCLVIDASCFAKVFNENNDQHQRFIPVLNWITNGQGSIIYGGKKYKKELKNARRYLAIIVELKKQGRVIELPDREVDEIAQEVRDAVNRDDFNDEHLVAIVRVARCRVVCTDDTRAENYLKQSNLYPKRIKKPKIYKNATHTTLCCSENVVGKCREQLRQRG